MIDEINIMKKKQELWIGLASVTPHMGSNTLGSQCKGAIVNVVAHAHDAIDFQFRLIEALENLMLDLQNLEDVEHYSKRISEYEVDESIRKTAFEVERDGGVGFGVFHTYPIEFN